MLISRNWLRDFVDLPADLDPRRLAERLTITTAEVDSVEHVCTIPPEVRLPDGVRPDAAEQDDWIIEIDNKSITHRPDLWGHVGIAREVAAILGLPPRPPPVAPMEQLVVDSLPAIPITIDDPAKCPRYSGLRMQALGNRPAPWRMQLRLARVGMRPISFLVDLTNYVMAELGQPMHAFDAATIDCIEVGLAAEGARFRTLDGVERAMPPGTLMIQCRRRNVAIAGIMGGHETEVSPTTREILLESANFDAATIRRAAAAMGHRTEASARFEKSLDPNLTVHAIARFVHLARTELPDLSLTRRLSDAWPRPLSVPTIELDAAHVSRIIGQDVSRERIRDILTPLEFQIRDAGSRLLVTPPTFRATKDISIPEDLIEEIARFVGYDHIPPALPHVEARPLDESTERIVERRSLELLCLGGSFIEAHQYAWFDDEWLARLRFDPGACLALRNPVAPSQVRLRTTLLPGLLAACERNRFRVGSFDLLELGSVFRTTAGAAHGEARASDPAALQSRHLALAVVRPGKKADDAVWAELKASIETWADQVARGALTYAAAPPVAPWDDPQRCCTLLLDGRAVGRATLVPSALKLRIDERLRTLSIGLAEIDLSGLDPDARAPRRLAPPPPFPDVQLDFSAIYDASRRYAELAGQLRAFSDPLLRRLHFVDSFEGGSIPAGKRSITLRAVLADPSRTLTEADLTRFRAAFTAHLARLGMELRA